MTSDNQSKSSNNALRMQSELFSHVGEVTWSLKNFPKFKDRNVVSNEFSIVPCCQIKWEIIIIVKSSAPHTNIGIRRKDEFKDYNFKVDIQCTLENSQGVVYLSYFLKEGVYDFHSSPKCLSISPQKETMVDWDLNSLTDDLLVVRFQIKLEDCCTKTETLKHEYLNFFPKHQLSTDLRRGLQMLLKEKPLFDVTLNVGGKSITAHKAILCARSPVFRSMFENDMKEMINGVVEMDDIQPQVMEEFLSYLYMDTIGGDVSLDMIRDLYAVADKYQVGCLQDKCGSVLLENLNEKTVCKTLKLADLHNDDILKEAASNYIGGNYATVKHNSDFKSLVKSDPPLVLHILMCKCLDKENLVKT